MGCEIKLENDWLVLQDNTLFSNYLDSEKECVEHIQESKEQGYKGVFTYRLMTDEDTKNT